MRTLAELLHPITLDQFRADYDDRKPLHIVAEAGTTKRALLNWDGFNTLLDQASIWTAQNLKLVFNGEPVGAEHYCREVPTSAGTMLRPSPARIQPLLSMGASLIADEAQALTPEIRALSNDLSRHFAGLAGANIYCSFGGIQAFNTHFDLHHVFAVQVEGEKIWRLYQNRADQPVAFPAEGPEARQWFARTRGPLLQEVHMRPGDVLYLPRGWYHDAMTPEGASLHVTFSVTPLYGRILFKLLEAAALQDPAFRAWLRPAAEDGGQSLGAQLGDLGQRLASLTSSRAFQDEIAMTQERLSPRPAQYTLPEQIPVVRLRPTGLITSPWSGPVAVAMEWVMSQPSVSLESVVAQFDFVPEADLRATLAEAERTGILQRL